MDKRSGIEIWFVGQSVGVLPASPLMFETTRSTDISFQATPNEQNCHTRSLAQTPTALQHDLRLRCCSVVSELCALVKRLWFVCKSQSQQPLVRVDGACSPCESLRSRPQSETASIPHPSAPKASRLKLARFRGRGKKHVPQGIANMWSSFCTNNNARHVLK